MLKTQASLNSMYQDKINEITSSMQLKQKQVNQFSVVRMLLFCTEIILVVCLVRSGDDGWRTLIQFGLTLPILLFLLVVRKQSKLDQEIEYQRQLLWIHQNELNVLRNEVNGYDDGEVFINENHPYSADLDIFGRVSLYAKINRCSTLLGKQLLADALSQKQDLINILNRQEAVKELKDKISATFNFRAHLSGCDAEKMQKITLDLQQGLSEQLHFVQAKFLRVYVAIMPYTSVLAILLAIFLGNPFDKILGFLFLFNLAIIGNLNKKITKVYYLFGSSAKLLLSFARAIKFTEDENWQSAYIKNLFQEKTKANTQIMVLAKIINRFDARLNILLVGVLNGLFLWDLRCCIQLNNWCKNQSSEVVNAINRLGHFEALISLATLNYNQPDWCFPQLQESFCFEAQSLGHPLIDADKRVENDFKIGNTATVDIITGSNMAGKSTFLRTLGINMVLAYAGAPVCAASLSLSIFSIVTYMRIIDSLSESTSTFKAELNRLKMILTQIKTDKNAIVLIDEMLRGTNSRDKYLGSKVFVEKLITEGTPALFATHDLQLADLAEQHPQNIRNFNFDISIKNNEMLFDYKLKWGACKTFNAAILLKEIGLSLETST